MQGHLRCWHADKGSQTILTVCPQETQCWRIAKKYLSAVSDEDLGYLSFEPVRSDFSTHPKVALVRGKFSPSAFYKEKCQFFIRDRFFLFFFHFYIFN